MKNLEPWKAENLGMKGEKFNFVHVALNHGFALDWNQPIVSPSLFYTSQACIHLYIP